MEVHSICDTSADNSGPSSFGRRTTDWGPALPSVVLQPLDWSKIPNIKNVDDPFRKAYSHGTPTDYGKVCDSEDALKAVAKPERGEAYQVILFAGDAPRWCYADGYNGAYARVAKSRGGRF